MYKYLITGGHVTPALAVISALQHQQPDAHIVFVGRKTANDKEEKNTFEYEEVTQRAIPFIHLNAGRLSRDRSVSALNHFFTIPRGFISAWRIIRSEKPTAIISFGGYIALPIAICAFLQRIPVYTHEQTISPGLANKLIGVVAKKIFVAFPQAVEQFPAHKTIAVGNPLRSELFQTPSASSELHNMLTQKDPVLYITGGSLGSHSINVLIESILPALLQQFCIIHQVGNIDEFGDFDRISHYRNTLSSSEKKRYDVCTHISSDIVGSVLQRADVVMSRAGANTFFELCAFRKPAVLIPLPWSGGGEQLKQANLFERLGVGCCFSQDKSPDELLETIAVLWKNRNRYQSAFAKISDVYLTHHAGDRMVEAIRSLEN